MEAIIAQTGGCGRYQILTSICVHCCKIILAFSMLFIVFGAHMTNWRCVDDVQHANVTSQFTMDANDGKCMSGNGTRKCQKFAFDPYTRTVTSEWSLVCDKAWIVGAIGSMQIAGIMVGNAAGGHIADAFGRKPTFYLAITGLVVLNALAVLSTSWVVYGVIRFLLGAAMGLQLVTQYALQCELMVTRWRSVVIVMPTWHLALMLFTLVAWLLHDWKHIHLVTAVFGVASLATACFVQESFRWKVVHDRTEDARKIINFMARVNNKPCPDKEVLDSVTEQIKQEETRLKERKYSVLDLIRTREMLWLTLPLSIIWFFTGAALYGLYFAVFTITGNLYVNMLIINCSNVVGGIVVHFMQNRYGRKPCLTGALLLFSVSCGGAGILPFFPASSTNGVLARVCRILALVIIDCVLSTLQTLTLENFQTVIRVIAYGTMNTMARTGSVVGTQLMLLNTIHPGLMHILLACGGLISVVALRPLPETMDRALRDVLPATTAAPVSHRLMNRSKTLAVRPKRVDREEEVSQESPESVCLKSNSSMEHTL